MTLQWTQFGLAENDGGGGTLLHTDARNTLQGDHSGTSDDVGDGVSRSTDFFSTDPTERGFQELGSREPWQNVTRDAEQAFEEASQGIHRARVYAAEHQYHNAVDARNSGMELREGLAQRSGGLVLQRPADPAKLDAPQLSRIAEQFRMLFGPEELGEEGEHHSEPSALETLLVERIASIKKP